MKSFIFTDAELQELERRKKGNAKDECGLFSARIKPKIIEMLEVWFPQKKDLEKLLKRRKRNG